MSQTVSPTVSIVIPCYNQGRFLGDAIESAQRQTYKGIEVIVVDDGSTDGSARVAAAYTDVRYFRQRNGGVAAVRAAGLRESRGELVIFLDADDRLLPHAVATGLESLAAHPAWAFVTGHVRLIAHDGSAAGIPFQDHPEPSFVALLRSNYIWTPGVVMHRRSVLEAVGPFDPSAGGSADYDLHVRIARRFAFGCHHHVILEYRQHRANMSLDAAYMLRSAVSVRRRLRGAVSRYADAHRAWKDGIRIVQEDFGGRVVDSIARDLRAPGCRGRALRQLWCLFRFHPGGLVALGRLITRRLTRTMRGMTRRPSSAPQ